MLRLVQLLLPIFFPSWRFFQSIEPSPRIQWTTGYGDQPPDEWRMYRPRPDAITPAEMAQRLFWNPLWNEGLFLVTLSERLIREDSGFAAHEIGRRIQARVQIPAGHNLWFRVIFLDREVSGITRHILYTSDAFAGAPHEP